MVKALWVYMVTGEFGLPTIYKPSIAVRELRKLFTYYNLLNRQIRMIKNGIQALLTENGINLEEAERKLLLKKNGDNTVIQKLELTSASILIITGELELLRNLFERKEKLTEAILLAGATFQKQVELSFSGFFRFTAEKSTLLILASSCGSSMIATTDMVPWHMGQISGSTLQTFCSNRAQLCRRNFDHASGASGDVPASWRVSRAACDWAGWACFQDAGAKR